MSADMAELALLTDVQRAVNVRFLSKDWARFSSQAATAPFTLVGLLLTCTGKQEENQPLGVEREWISVTR